MKKRQKNKQTLIKPIWWVIGAVVLASLMVVALRRDDFSDLIIQTSGPRLISYQGNGYQISYPENWKVDDSEQEAPAIVFTSPDQNAKLYIQTLYDPRLTKSSEQSLMIADIKESFKQNPDYTVSNSQNTTVNERTAYVVEGTFTDKGEELEFREYTIFGDDGYYYSLRINNEPGQHQKAVDVMVGSFKITSPNPDEVKAWELVEKLAEVQNFKKLVESGGRSTLGVRVDRTPTTEEPYYFVQVYESFPDHTTTFNWYRVNPKTRVVERQNLATDTWEEVN